MSITLYGDPISRAQRVEWMLKELNVPFDHVPTPFMDGSTRLPEFLKINPNGRVPALQDGELRLFESLAINLYLARKHGGPLAPADLQEDGLATQWTLWVALEIEKALLLLSADYFFFEEEGRDPEEAALILGKLDRPFRVLDAHLRERSYLMGERFTVADLNVSSVMLLIYVACIDVSPWPAMKAWLARCLERPLAPDWKAVKFSLPRPPTERGVLLHFI